MKVKLTYVSNTPKVSKAGKPYTSCSIKTVEHGEEWLNGFGNAQTKSWNPGDEVEVDVYEEEYMGKTYTKFKTLTAEDRVAELATQLKTICDVVRNIDLRLKVLEANGMAKEANKAPSAGRFEKEVHEDTLDVEPFTY